jgi:hypothetical protein
MDFTPTPVAQNSDIACGAAKADRSRAIFLGKMFSAISEKELVQASIGMRVFPRDRESHSIRLMAEYQRTVKTLRRAGLRFFKRDFGWRPVQGVECA